MYVGIFQGGQQVQNFYNTSLNLLRARVDPGTFQKTSTKMYHYMQLI